MTQLNQLIVELTNACNAKCHFCPNRLSTRPVTHMPLDLYTRIIEEVAELGFATDDLCLGLCGIGEPLLHPQFEECMRVASERGVPFGVGTNGHLLGQHIDAMVKYDPSEVCFSIDATTATAHGKIRPGISFQKIKKGILQYLERIRGGEVLPRKLWIQMVVVDPNVKQSQRFAEEWLPLVESIPTAKLFFKCVCPWPYHECNSFYPSPVPKLTPDVIHHPQVVFAGFDPPLRFQSTCGLFDGFGQVLSDGSYVPCCMPTRDYWGIGNAARMSLVECFHSEVMEQLRQLPKTSIPFCKDCV